jgi:serine phosphatase RsbU (regulator of sigma subunit)
MVLLSRLWLEVRYLSAGGVARSDRRSFWGEAMWSGVLVLGPTATWLGLVLPFIPMMMGWPRSTKLEKLHLISQAVFRLSVVVPTLIEAWLYVQFGGRFPLPGLRSEDVTPAVLATLLGFAVGSVMIGLSTAINRVMIPPIGGHKAATFANPRSFLLITLVGPVAGLVGIVPAGLYTLAGLGGYFAFQAIMLGGVWMVDRLSRTAEHTRQRTLELTHLEGLGQAILKAPADGSQLSKVLQEHVPMMFDSCRVAIRVYPDRTLVAYPNGWEGSDPSLWDWEQNLAEPMHFHPGEDHPPYQQPDGCGLLVVPILQPGNGHAAGRILIERREAGADIHALMPAAQSLASQIGSALVASTRYKETLKERLARQKVSQELKFAGQIQNSFLPAKMPKIAGMEIAAALEAARETSGDFYDVIPMWDGRIGLVIADVADKGMGAALYMALCRTLIRVYAVEYSTRYPDSYAYHPERVVNTVNKWIVEDSPSDMFVTLFYGIYDPSTRTLTYTNAGHNPPYLYCPAGGTVEKLGRTGIPVGLFPELNWERGAVSIRQGDVLVLYTDGVTEAQSRRGVFYGEKRLHKALRPHLMMDARELVGQVLKSIRTFTGTSAHADDITLLIVKWADDETLE